jgi:hypothetical protein
MRVNRQVGEVRTVSATEVSPQAVHIGEPLDRAADRYDAVAQYSVRQVLGKRFQSTWMGLITHTLPSFVIIGVVLSLVI